MWTSPPPPPGHFSNDDDDDVVHVNDDDDDVVHVNNDDDVVHVSHDNDDIVQVQDSDYDDLPVGRSSSSCGDAESLVCVCVLSAVTRTPFNLDLDGHCSRCQCRAACIGEDRG